MQSSSSSTITFFSEELLFCRNRNIFESNTRKIKQVRICERTLCDFKFVIISDFQTDLDGMYNFLLTKST